MSVIFPSNPSTNQTFTNGSFTWIWNGRAWSLQPAAGYVLPQASTTSLGGVKTDGTTISANASGVISVVTAGLPTATTSNLGLVKPDGTTITIANGVISAVSGGGGGGGGGGSGGTTSYKLDASADVLMTTVPAGTTTTSFNGGVEVSLSLNSSVLSAGNTIVKRDGASSIFSSNFYASGAHLTAGSGGAYNSTYYQLINEDNSLGNRYTAVYRRDYVTNGVAQTIGIRVGSDGDNNNYHYAAYHIFDSYGQQRITGSANGAAYISSADSTFHGTAVTAQYADLAEKYLPDTVYEIGTVVTLGGNKEITASIEGSRGIGAISDRPAYLMNKDLTDGIPVALKGRVPVKVIGSVNKGDDLVATDNGCARAATATDTKIFAVAIESNADQEIKLVEALIL